MSTFTEHYNLILPSLEDYYDVQDFNENTEALDGLLFEQEQAIAGVKETAEEISQKIGTPEDEGEDTLFGALNHQTESFYVPGNTVQQVLLENIEIPTNGKTISALNFTAQHDGVVRIQWDIYMGTYVASNHTYIYILSGNMTEAAYTLPIGSNLTSITDLVAETNNKITYETDQKDITLHYCHYFSVRKGMKYVGYLHFSNCMGSTLEKMELCYDITTKKA